MPNFPITNRKIRFALVGCGRISRNHFDSIAQHAGSAELVDVCDIDPAALGKAIESTGAAGHTDISTLLEKTSADCVVLTTPSGLHPSQTIEVARSGRHVLSEKPMATKWEDGVRMVRACEDAGVHLFVVKQNRKNATLQLLKQAVAQKRFGQIYMVTLNVFWQRPQVGYYDQAKWRGTWDMDGGAFMNQASHYVDLLEWLIGPIDSLHAYTATLARDIEAEDTGVLSVKWRNGALGSLNCTMLTYPKNLEGSITILGENGTVRVGGVAVNEIQEWKFADPHPDDEKIKAASYETTSVYGFGHPLYYENVIKTLRGEAHADVDGREGLKSLEVLIATYRSARDGVRVGLPLEL
jgi:UDP-N-acetyl-2-amino-2-deoxyglucuronate dehydrogenase